MKTLVVGCGDLAQGDAGVGYRVAEAVAALVLADVTAKPCYQLPLELLADIAEVDRLIWVDAATPQNPCSAIFIERLAPKAAHEAVYTHHDSLQDLLARSQTLYNRTPLTYSILLPTRDFCPTEQLSPIAMAGIKQALSRIYSLIKLENFS